MRIGVRATLARIVAWTLLSIYDDEAAERARAGSAL
jgi:hypothetical protein